MTLATPAALLLLLLLPLQGWFRRRSQHHGFFDPHPMLRDSVHRPRQSPYVFHILAWLLLVLGLAGPQWGTGDEAAAVGRDVVIVLDFSRSMWAEDMRSSEPARWQAAVHGARDLIHACQRRGGDRVALVVFSARPLLIAPLTTDYDHLLMRLDTLDARTPPAEIRPEHDDDPSGTRLGTAIVRAVNSHDARFPGFQEIVLFTDADDPASDDEWRKGITAARTASIPVHVVGLGDPASDAFVLRHGEPLEGPDGFVKTRLHEDVAGAIVRETRGEYLAARTLAPDLAAFDRAVLEAAPKRDVNDERRPQPRDQSHWFFAAAALALTLAWWK